MFNQVVVKQWGETSEGTYLQVFIPGVKVKEEHFVDGFAKGVLKIDDSRTISAAQRGLLYSLFKEIAIHFSEKRDSEYIKEHLKKEFTRIKGIELFSLSDVDLTTAREFIEYVLEFTFNSDVPLSSKVTVLAKECANWSYLCFKKRECEVCRKKGAHAHHVDTVGMGRNRNKQNHTKHRMMMLCAHHHEEIHRIGNNRFSDKYHVTGNYYTEEVLREVNIKGYYGEEADVWRGPKK